MGSEFHSGTAVPAVKNSNHGGDLRATIADITETAFETIIGRETTDAEQRSLRRDALRSAACGFGGLALAGLATRDASAATTHFAPRAKRVIFLFMHGGVRLYGSSFLPAKHQAIQIKLANTPSKVPEIANLRSELLTSTRQRERCMALMKSHRTDSVASVYRLDAWRKLVFAEAGVRFVQVSSGYHWDHHGNIERDLPVSAEQTDKPAAAFVEDLDRR